METRRWDQQSSSYVRYASCLFIFTHGENEGCPTLLADRLNPLVVGLNSLELVGLH